MKPDYTPVTNLSYLTSLSKGNSRFIREMIDTFLIENPKEIVSLMHAIRSKNFEAIKQAAHRLQSSIPFVGLDKFIESEVCEIEKIASGQPGNLKAELPAANDQALQTIEFLSFKVKAFCEKACLELTSPGYLLQEAEIQTSYATTIKT
jgi:HPt (histidine-containing phosphotransfer) domain-containing protein